MKGTTRLLAVSMPLLLLLPACGPKQENGAEGTAAAVDPHQPGAMMKPQSTVVIPPSQAGKWKGVTLAIEETGRKPVTQDVPLGADCVLPGTGLTVRVDHVLPDFTMGGGVITSKSDTLANPAAQVAVTEGGKQIFQGWMFSLFPEAHAFQHPKYSIKLVALVPVG